MKTLLRMVAAASAVSAFSAFAQGDDLDIDVGADDSGDQAIAAVGDDSAAADEDSDSGEEGGESAAGTKKPRKTISSDHIFKTLPFCARVEGHAEVLKPGVSEWQPVEEGKFYPLGSTFRTDDNVSRLKMQFGESEDISVEIAGAKSSFGTRFQSLGEKTRTVSLKSGVISVKLPRNAPDNVFKIVAPGFEVLNPKGVSRYAYTATVDGDVAQMRCITGSFSVKGRNFYFPEVKTACEVKIRTSQDQLFTGLYGNRGDSPVLLDQGDRLVKDFTTGETSVVKQPLEWKLSPKTAVRIHRAIPAIGERMSVTVMTFDAAGSLQNRCAFAEGCTEINTGELGPAAADSSEKEELARKAAEAADVEAVDADADASDSDEAPAEDAGEAPAENAGGASGGDDDFEF